VWREVKVGWFLVDFYAMRLSGLENKLFQIDGRHSPEVCELPRLTRIPQKEAGGNVYG
jgi:hypothetical protein